MYYEKIVKNFLSLNDPIELICSKEFVLGVFQFGSYLSIIHNKRINPSTLFVSILEYKDLRTLFTELTYSENEREALLNLLQLYPALLKSKNTKRLFKKSIKP
jgi:hypothetical protein